MTKEKPISWRGPRRIVNLYDSPYEAYDLEGEVQDNVHLLNISYDRDRATGWYVIRMEPGTASIPHEHAKHEEYLILEGELIESDGTVLKKAISSVIPRTVTTTHGPKLAACSSAMTAIRIRIDPQQRTQQRWDKTKEPEHLTITSNNG